MNFHFEVSQSILACSGAYQFWNWLIHLIFFPGPPHLHLCICDHLCGSVSADTLHINWYFEPWYMVCIAMDIWYRKCMVYILYHMDILPFFLFISFSISFLSMRMLLEINYWIDIQSLKKVACEPPPMTRIWRDFWNERRYYCSTTSFNTPEAMLIILELFG